MFAMLIAATLVQTPLPLPDATPDVTAAEAAWNACVEQGIAGTAAAEAPRPASVRIAAACQPQADAVLAANTAWIQTWDRSETAKRRIVRQLEILHRRRPQRIEAQLRASRRN